jgi:hypothetical protein
MFEYFNNFWAWADDNPEKIDPYTIAVYMVILSRANRLGWKDKFSIVLIDLQESTGIASRTTMLKCLLKLEENGFISTVSYSKNQYKNRIICLPLNEKHMNSTRKANEKQMESTRTHHKTIKTNKTIKENKEYRSIDEIKSFTFFSKDEKLNEAFKNFLINRITIKAYPTTLGIRNLLKQIGKIYKTPEEAIEGIEVSIQSNYKGLFPLNKNNFKQPQTSTVTRAQMGIKMQ